MTMVRDASRRPWLAAVFVAATLLVRCACAENCGAAPILLHNAPIVAQDVATDGVDLALVKSASDISSELATITIHDLNLSAYHTSDPVRGTVVAVDGKWLLAGQPESASVHVFANNTLHQTLKAPQGFEGSRFGASVAISGDVLIVGSPSYRNEQSFAVIYRQKHKIWVPEATLNAPPGVENFGTAVDIRSQVAAVAAPGIFTCTCRPIHRELAARGVRVELHHPFIAIMLGICILCNSLIGKLESNERFRSIDTEFNADKQEEIDQEGLLNNFSELLKDEGQGTNVISKTPPLFSNEEEGRLRNASLKALFDVKDPEFSMFKQTEKPPSLYFLKLHKVGGTSVALALKNASVHYKLNECNNRRLCKRHDHKEIFFQHSRNAAVIDEVFPETALVTVFREPVSHYLSKMTWIFNRKYFMEYPLRACDYSEAVGDKPPLLREMKFVCHDDAVRHNATLSRFLTRLEGESRKELLCDESCSWITQPASRDPSVAIQQLTDSYALYTTTEHLDEFLVLLALRFGWSIDTMIYEKCKDEGEAKISSRDLVGEHAWALEKIKRLTKNANVVYEHAKTKFESFVGKLGPEFPKLVAIFKERVRVFQEHVRASRENPKRWRRHKNVLMC
ncbi:Hypothetical Protein FCC1311_039962 [Hondaea fermentalgiana]|uniref:Galactose-3-O-sulfotransferase 3 n=1 Tax=Hondaea fermentalgiana TaxID=2315210 RepID=A0A2R5GGJ4_9STRA|nr:Hypothetical Protein FCC1311_039962 [Hondaea fermentalgiana]|eukprot:GBG27773.1 Hypothetical Protein FCC1311_039962 [Hondaea fermentalgiana]